MAFRRAVQSKPAPKSPVPSSVSQEKPCPERVAEMAFELYQKRGGQHGHDLEDWLAAERIVAGNQRPA